ncbi:RNA-directed DNA polymerase, eukaryota, Reverse transcriptase zinc-binding domain protein [Artemisia annua]|uniref:RNA-directed DNA polymerase, eukaryota, Reverse transcriptase zinc-binding domain protein n=1 Tax=Artemisia annua TaxID=35608 RepID=A0A2U1Q3U0_ARTAN|nr:RNA-directed DNA polymerase, eukaryota, Reverse transcriptase zinc-binding domain protein [Artemisia annua]
MAQVVIILAQVATRLFMYAFGLRRIKRSSFVPLSHNRYTHRRPLLDNLKMHKLYTRARPWCILGDFNSALHLEDKVAGSSVIDISMREFKECIDEIELVDINRSGLQFTWNQKPRGLDGTLKKIDRIMANFGFMDLFVGAHAIFQPYRISDHSPAILTIPTAVTFKPRPFKFANILIQNPRFKEKVKEAWDTNVSGFFMYRVVSKLKLLKKPLHGLLFNEVVKSRKARSRIDSVCNSDGVRFDQDQVPNAFVSHFTSFLGQEGNNVPFNGDELFHTSLDPSVANHMV